MDKMKLMTIEEKLLTAELMATIESLIIYSTNLDVRSQAFKRLMELKMKYDNNIQLPFEVAFKRAPYH